MKLGCGLCCVVHGWRQKSARGLRKEPGVSQAGWLMTRLRLEKTETSERCSSPCSVPSAV